MIESKIGSPEREGQLRKYAEYLAGMEGYGRKTLLYITRRDDPKDGGEILRGLEGNVRFQQLRWHDFHRFLEGAEGDALAEEVKVFMAERGDIPVVQRVTYLFEDEPCRGLEAYEPSYPPGVRTSG